MGLSVSDEGGDIVGGEERICEDLWWGETVVGLVHNFGRGEVRNRR